MFGICGECSDVSLALTFLGAILIGITVGIKVYLFYEALKVFFAF